jgi:hypothetical protein
LEYSIDTSAILDAWNRYYPPDIFSALWNHLEKIIEDGLLRASVEVMNELERKDDQVYRWARKNPDLFIDIDEEIQNEITGILSKFPKLLDTRAQRSGADPFVIALAKINTCCVITGERATRKPDRPNIPDVCSALEIRAISVLDLIREQKWKF